jgi:hypothetical protein
MNYIIEGKSWNGIWMRLIKKSGGKLDVVSMSDADYEHPLVFYTRKEAESVLPDARAIATACELNIEELIDEEIQNDSDILSVLLDEGYSLEQLRALAESKRDTFTLASIKRLLS